MSYNYHCIIYLNRLGRFTNAQVDLKYFHSWRSDSHTDISFRVYLALKGILVILESKTLQICEMHNPQRTDML